MRSAITIQDVDRWDNRIIVEFSDGTLAYFSVEELLKLRPESTGSRQKTD